MKLVFNPTTGNLDWVASLASDVGLTGLATSITAGKTLTLAAVDNYTLTVPATGIAALLATANVFTTNQTITPSTDVIGLTLNKPSTANNFEIKSGSTILARFDNSGYLHIGGTQANTRLYVQASSASIIELSAFVLINSATGGTPSSGLSFYGYSRNTSGSMGGVHGATYTLIHDRAGTVVNLTGEDQRVTMSAGTVTNYRGYWQESLTVSGATVTNVYLIDLITPTISSGSISNLYGIRIGNMQGAGSTNYSIYTGTGLVRFGGGLILPYVAKTADYTLTQNDYTVNCTANTFNITLPTAVGFAGQVYNIVNTGSGNIQMLTTSSQTVCGYTSGTLYLYPGESLTVQSNGTNWIVN